jgi:esterase/lipase superfamily enzyme
VISVAKGWYRPALLLRAGLTALVACGLLTGCSETPKIGKNAENQSRSIAEAPATAPAPSPTSSPEASAPEAPAAPSPQVAPSDAERQSQAKEDEAEQQQPTSHKRYYKKAAPRAAPEPSETAQSERPEGGSGGAATESREEQPRTLGEVAAPSKPAPVEAAPPSEEAAAPPPPPPAAAPSIPTAQPDLAAESASPLPSGPPDAAARSAAAAGAARSAEEAARAAVERDAAKSAATAAPVPDPAKTYGVVPVFYGTDRAVQPDPNRLQFSSERGHKLQLGRAMITVPLIHKVPHIERPWVIEIPYFKLKVYEEKEDPAKHFTVQEISSLTEDQMLALVRAQLAKSQTFKDHALVFVHGFNTTFDNALYRTAQIAYDLKFDGVPFVYSWPSGGGVASYTYDHGSVEQAEPTLTEFLNLVIQKSGAKSISLIAHSMGNELLLRVLQQIKTKIPPGVVISQVILAAPDVDRDKFNIIAREITNFAKGVTLYAASNDRALGYSERFWGGVPRAGDIPASGPLIIPGVDTIDVTAVSTDALGLNHSGYAENPALLNDVKALVEYGIRPPNKRLSTIVPVESAAGMFWRFEASN